MTDELVFVVARDLLMADDAWHGIRTANPGQYLALIERHGYFAPRGSVEQDASVKQVIPYLVLRDGDRYFLMRRTRSGGDARLHDRYSIGVGGHLNRGDDDVAGGLRREWREEIEASFVPDFTFVGLLNDDTTDVGRVHLGIVHVADAAGRPASVRERNKLEGGFVDAAAVEAVHARLETWSQIVFDFLEHAGGGVRERAGA